MDDQPTSSQKKSAALMGSVGAIVVWLLVRFVIPQVLSDTLDHLLPPQQLGPEQPVLQPVAHTSVSPDILQAVRDAATTRPGE